MRRLLPILALLACSPASADSGFMEWPTLPGAHKRTKPWTLGAHIPDDPGTVIHWTAENFAANTLTPAIGPTFTTTGTLSQTATITVPQYAHEITGWSDSNWLSIAANNVASFSGGNWRICCTFRGGGGQPVLVDMGPNGGNGYFFQLVGYTNVMTGGAQFGTQFSTWGGGVNLMCGGRAGMTGYVRVNAAPTISASLTTNVQDTTDPLVIGRYGPAGGFSFQGGSLYECMFSTKAASAADFDAIATQVLGTKIYVAIGDSITDGSNGGVTVPWPSTIAYKVGNGFTFQNAASSGMQTSAMLTRWTNNVRGKGYQAVTILGGVNDLANGGTAAATFSNLQTMYDQARADGMKLVIMTISPWKNSTFGGWNTTQQAETDTLNADIRAYAATNHVPLVDLYTLLADPNDAQSINPAYNNGDHLHPNQAGTDVIAAAVKSALGL